MKFLKKEKADILHARSRFPAWVSFLACKYLPVENRPRFITTFHGPYSVNTYSRVMLKGERVIAVSDYIRRYILDNFQGIDEKKIEVIPRGVDPQQFPHGYRPDPSWLTNWSAQHANIQDKFVIALPGRVTRRKGHEDFINIIGALVSDNLPVHGLIIGGPHSGKGHFFEQLLFKVKTAGLDNHITFLGHRNDIREILSVSNTILSLSKEPEAFGRTVLEALCLGKPVIAYDIGGTTEILKGIFPAGIGPHNQPKSVIAKIREFIQQSPPVTAHCPFTLEQMLGKTIRLYEKLCP
jgi:glycosyltransferase involved in cell wall biosynthesis